MKNVLQIRVLFFFSLSLFVFCFCWLDPKNHLLTSKTGGCSSCFFGLAMSLAAPCHAGDGRRSQVFTGGPRPLKHMLAFQILSPFFSTSIMCLKRSIRFIFSRTLCCALVALIVYFFNFQFYKLSQWDGAAGFNRQVKKKILTDVL